jgi:23S rRNA (pseudouridine1915-N3)-methyltransferase
MLHIRIAAVGKCRERYFADACAEYAKRLGAFCKLDIAEVEEYRLPATPSDGDIERCLAEEGKALLTRIPERAQAVALCVEGKALDSRELSREIAGMAQRASSLVFLIGGSHGLSEEVKEKCALRLSLSAMTLPHQLARVVLLEQVYRAFCMLQNRKYHK